MSREAVQVVAAGELRDLVARARAVLAENDVGGWTKPAPNLYPHQWNWDSCFIAIGLSRYDQARAEEEIRSLLRGQWKNGLVPQIVFNPKGNGYFPGPEIWQCVDSPEAPDGIQTSGITQPPVLATAALAVRQNARDREQANAFLREVYPKILAYHRFFYRERNPDGDGLIVVVHPWESGLDNSPPYLDAGKRVQMAYKPQYKRLDLRHVPARNRPSNRDYDLYVYLLEQMLAANWDQRRYLEHAPLQVQDVLFDSILCRANRDLARIAEIVGEDPAEAQGWREQTARAINDRLWDEEDNTYFSRDRVAGRLLRDSTVSDFMPLYAGIAPQDRAIRLIEVNLINPRLFWPEAGYPVPSTALDSPYLHLENYWLGPTWINTNWLLIHGLVEYGYLDLAADLTRLSLELVQRSGYREYFNPRTGEGYGTDRFSWSAALTIDLVGAMTSEP